MSGQTYSALWKQAKAAEEQDLPRSQYDILMKIAQKAEHEKAYGQLLSAELQGARVMSEIAPDSLLPAIERMEARMQALAGDDVLTTIYQVVLHRIFKDNPQLERTPQQVVLTAELCRKLAAVKASLLEPLTVNGTDSRIFDDDMLSVIGYETEQFDPLHAYYQQKGNRRATLLTALEMLRQQRPQGRTEPNKSIYLQRIDSLIAEYSDLVECGEAAIERYNYLSDFTTATIEERWQYINLALERWGSWKCMNELRNSQHQLTAPRFAIEGKMMVNIPNTAQTLELGLVRNIRQLTVRLYSVKAQGDISIDPDNTDGYRRIKPLLTPLPNEISRQYIGKKTYETFTDSLQLPALPEGVYMIEVESTPTTQVERRLYFVSNVRVLAEELPHQTIRYVVVNATTGEPLKGAHIRLAANGKTVATLTTDQAGEARYTYQNVRPGRVFAYTDRDKFCPTASLYTSFYYNSADRNTERCRIFTDRSIYRPGQTVRASVIAYTLDNGYEHHANQGKKITLELRDANNKPVSEQTVTTDNYGTAAADFVLPTGKLNGTFSLRGGGNSYWFRVEEYKRPTFEVKFPDVNQHYENGDTVQVRATARSFAGVPVQGAKVRYNVIRRRAWWCIFDSPASGEEIVRGEATTAADGTFVVDIPMTMPESQYPQFYNFTCTADVTDQSGETAQGQLTLPLGNRKTSFSCDLPEKILKEEQPQLTFHLRNVAGIDIDAKVKYRVDNSKWTAADTQKPLTLQQMKSGSHTLEAVCNDDTLKQQFVVFSLDDKRPATYTSDWCYQSAAEFPNDGSPVTIQVGSSDENVHIFYTIIARDSVIESGVVEKSNALINRKLTYKEEYGHSLLLTFAWVKQGKVYTHNMNIQRPLPDKKLTLSWDTFRDHLTPGQKEEWKLTVKTPDGKPADAQLMATLYDKSLDMLKEHKWTFNPMINLRKPITSWNYSRWGGLWLSATRDITYLPEQQLLLTHLDDNVFPHYYSRMLMATAGPRRMAKASRAETAPMEANIKVFDCVESFNEESLQGSIGAFDVVGDDSEPSAAIGPQQQVQMRENLQETAFFYPQLTTDSTGIVTLKFTLPESLTTWRLMALAHTADMMYGTLEGEAVAQKEAMIQPNVPRFVRMGDKATITARLINLSSNKLKAAARMQIIDPETEKVLAQATQQTVMAADSTVSVTFSCEPTAEWPTVVICRTSISGSNFSDGEQHYMPILPATERVTVTLPFTQIAAGTKTIDLTQLFPKTQTNQSTQNAPKFTIEYTNNPAWLMMLALPTIGHPYDNCAVCQAAALYANTLGKHIVDRMPNARQTFEQWRREDTQFTTLNSQLEKNQELKDLILEETPWVAEADNEQEQRRLIANFFDDNTISQRTADATNNLRALQRTDGSWSWWPGMPGSTYMTIAISQMLVRLAAMTGKKQPMLDNAFKFLGKEMTEIVNELKKQEKKGHKPTFPGTTALQWLYICKIDGRQLPSSVQQANQYLIALLKKETKNQTIYEKAMTSIILGSTNYIKSLKEYTVYKEEMGRYYDTPRAAYSWRDYRIPTQVAAIEALQLLAPDDKQTIAEMCRWLLQQKRTQSWDTPLNAVDAIYAFQNTQSIQSNQSTPTTQNSQITIDGKPLATPNATAGLGYVKTAQTYSGEKTLTVEKTSDGTSWGAVYAQFMQSTSDIKDNSSGVTINREIILNNQSNQNTLKVGNRITVRITINSERDLDFVQVQDKRAACLEPVNQLSGYNWRGGYYCSPRDNTTNYFYDRLTKGKHVIETEYYVDREGQYETGTCTVQCAYAPEYRGNCHSVKLRINN